MVLKGLLLDGRPIFELDVHIVAVSADKKTETKSDDMCAMSLCLRMLLLQNVTGCFFCES